MVAVQGARSTISCTNCKTRKKGCDFKKPTCSRCERGGLACQYAARQYAFVAVSDARGQRRSKSHSPEDSAEGAIVLRSTSSQASLLQTDFSMQATQAFWLIFLPTEDPALDGHIGGLLAAPWIPVVRQLAEYSAFVRQAIEACAYAGLGWLKDDRSLVQYGMRPYVSALREINMALQDPQQATTDAVLAGCRVLSLFEMLRKLPASRDETFPTTSWQSHAEGAYQLLRLRGRAKHLSSHGAHLYDGVRLMGVFQGLNQRKTNDFTRLLWDLPQRDLRDHLFDIMSSVPTLFEESDRLVAACSQSAASSAESLILRGNELLLHYYEIAELLSLWEEQAFTLCRAPLVDGFVRETSLSGECTTHGYAFFYACEQYWASCLITYRSCHVLHDCLQQLLDAGSISTTLSGVPAIVDPEQHLYNIANTCSYFFAPQAGLWSAQAAVFPLSVSLVYLLRTGRRSSPMYGAIIAAIGSSKSGSVLSDFIHSLTS